MTGNAVVTCSSHVNELLVCRLQNLGPGQLNEIFTDALAGFQTLAAQPVTGSLVIGRRSSLLCVLGDKTLSTLFFMVPTPPAVLLPSSAKLCAVGQHHGCYVVQADTGVASI